MLVWVQARNGRHLLAGTQQPVTGSINCRFAAAKASMARIATCIQQPVIMAATTGRQLVAHGQTGQTDPQREGVQGLLRQCEATPLNVAICTVLLVVQLTVFM